MSLHYCPCVRAPVNAYLGHGTGGAPSLQPVPPSWLGSDVLYSSAWFYRYHSTHAVAAAAAAASKAGNTEVVGRNTEHTSRCCVPEVVEGFSWTRAVSMSELMCVDD